MRPRPRLLLSGALAIVLAGCAAPIPTAPVVVTPPPIAVPAITPMSLNAINWQVLTTAQLQALLAKAQAAHQDLVLLALDSQNFRDWSLNLVEIRRYIQEQQAVIAMLKAALQARADPADHKTPTQ